MSLVPLLLALVACAKHDAKSEMSRLRSWTATTNLAAELRGVGSTNGAVTGQILQRAIQARTGEARKLAALAQTDSQRMAAHSLLDSLQAGIARLQRVAR
jgi:hypothetical protein